MNAGNDDDELHRMISEQRRELAAAVAAESDLDLAFKIQLQEAINASLSSQPSSSHSSSSSTPPPFHFPDGDFSDPGFAYLLDEEFESFEREINDRKQVEAEMKSMRADLNRRIHDQVFAHDLYRVPEHQWKETGDHFQRPYDDGEGSSVAPDSETFRLYFIGLVREEMVGDVKKTFAGIGVAICGKHDHPIFELRKPLIGGEMIGEVVEIIALIEGLNAAVTLGLKRLTIFCHDDALHQIVTGKLLPGSGKIATLIDQVTLLQRKFSYCNPSLVALMDIKFAFKLARDAIDSQVTRPAETNHPKNMTETCGICLEDKDVTQMFPIDDCMHRYCFSCMKQHAEAKLLQGFLPKCPHEGCNSELKLKSCKKFLTPEVYHIMSQRIKESSIPAAEKVYCPYPRCSALMSKTEVLGNATTGALGVAIRCVKCYGFFCMICKVPWHGNMTCDAYKLSNPHPCAEDAKLKSLATRNLWRQCMKCNHMVELAEGCYHIYCRCGYEFCYTCGAEWKNKKATCRCPIWDERNIIYNDRDRPQQRRV